MSLRPKIYLAGPLFSLSERMENEKLCRVLERWCEVFGCLPPNEAGQGAPTAQPSEAEPQLDDLDTMTRADVARRLRASISTVQRMEN